MPVLQSDLETSDEGFESQSNGSETAEIPPQTDEVNSSSDKQTSINTSIKRTTFVEKLRSISTNNVISRNIQRCAVSRRISNEKNTEETQTIPSQLPIAIHRISSNKPKATTRNINSSSFARPLRAFQIPTMTNNSSSSSPKTARKSSSTSYHHVTVQKTFISRTILTTVLPSSTSLINQKNN